MPPSGCAAYHPALAASSPIAEGRPTGFMDFRMEAYRTHQAKIPSTIARVIPDTVTSRAEYQATSWADVPDIAPFDPDGFSARMAQCPWCNPTLQRKAIEIRVIDLQECPQADLAIAAPSLRCAGDLRRRMAAALHAAGDRH